MSGLSGRRALPIESRLEAMCHTLLRRIAVALSRPSTRRGHKTDTQKRHDRRLADIPRHPDQADLQAKMVRNAMKEGLPHSAGVRRGVVASLRPPESRSDHAGVLCIAVGRARASAPRCHPASRTRSPQPDRISSRAHRCPDRARVHAPGDGDPPGRSRASGRVAAHPVQSRTCGPQASAATRARCATAPAARHRTHPSASSRRRADARRRARLCARIRRATARRSACA
jgi:hypothetical protein